MSTTGNDEECNPTQLTMTDHAWGCVVSGTRIQMIAAGIVPLDQWPTLTKDRHTYHGAFPVRGRMRQITIENDTCPTDTRAGDVWVHYRDDERDSGSRVGEALVRLGELQRQIQEVVASIKPIPLSRILAIPDAVTKESELT